MDNSIFKCIFFLLPLVTGCAEQAYDGGEKPSTEVAVIKNSYTSRGGLQSDRADIIAVDDNYFDGSPPGRVDVLPGEHSVVIRCWHGGLIADKSTGLQGRQGPVQFVAKAGREYEVVCSVDSGKFEKWITDLTTDEVVGRQKPVTSR
jgi:hypothetical protein